jgi:ERCC4-type nuclease
MTIVVDTREQTPLPFPDGVAVVDTLKQGDYSFRGAEDIFAIERKSIPDLVQSLMQGRTFSQSREKAYPIWSNR